jgi:heme-degrading monooxygenase HmoA
VYGTVAHLRLKPGAEARLQQVMRDFAALNVPGFIFEQLYRLDADPNTYVMVVGFDSRSAYEANANNPEQHARYLEYRQLLEGDPEWHDGQIVYSYPAG